jgi:hypothetical protein
MRRRDNSEEIAMIDKWLRDPRVNETARILALASLSLVLGVALEHPFGLIQSIFYAVVAAVLLFSLVRGAWKRDASLPVRR